MKHFLTILAAVLTATLATAQPLTLNDPAIFLKSGGGTVSTLQGGQSVSNATVIMQMSGVNYEGSTWTNSATFTLTSLLCYLGTFNGVGPGTISALIYAGNDTVPIGSALATSINTIAITSMTTGAGQSGTQCIFTFAGLAMTPGKYALVLRLNGTPSANTICYVRTYNGAGAGTRTQWSITGADSSWVNDAAGHIMYHLDYGF